MVLSNVFFLPPLEPPDVQSRQATDFDGPKSRF
jgi:hypothetical protein